MDNSVVENNSGVNGFNSSRRILLRKVVSITNESDEEGEEKIEKNESKHYLKNTECY